LFMYIRKVVEGLIRLMVVVRTIVDVVKTLREW